MSGPQLQTQRNKRRRKFTKFLDLYYTYFPPFFFLLHPSPGFVSFLLHPLDIIPTEHEEKKRRLLMLYIAGALSLSHSHVPTSIRRNGSLHIASSVWICAARQRRLLLLHEHIRNVAQSFPLAKRKTKIGPDRTASELMGPFWPALARDGKQYVYIHL